MKVAGHISALRASQYIVESNENGNQCRNRVGIMRKPMREIRIGYIPHNGVDCPNLAHFPPFGTDLTRPALPGASLAVPSGFVNYVGLDGL
jgi:hypothetical protein